MRLLQALLLTAALLPAPVLAQDRAQTLADIRTELTSLNAEFNALKQELVSTGAVQSGIAGGSALQRMDTMEAAITTLTAKAEELELRLNRVVADGTNRLGDLEFRLCEMEEGCDIGAIGQTAPIGGVAGAPAAPTVSPSPAPAPGGAELAVSEQADFDRAKEVLGQGDFRTAADLLATFATTYTGGPLTYEAHFLRGEALSQLGETANAARAYLESFSGEPDGPRAPEALVKLGQALGQLGQTPEACVTLTEVGVRFPGSPSAQAATAAMQGLGCS